MQSSDKPFSGLFLLAGIVIAAILFLQGIKVSFDSAAKGMKVDGSRQSTNVEIKKPAPAPIEPNDAIVASNDVELKEVIPLGIIKETVMGYDGWSLRICPSLVKECLGIEEVYLESGDQVELLRDLPILADGVQWVKVRSVKLNEVGWITRNGINF